MFRRPLKVGFSKTKNRVCECSDCTVWYGMVFDDVRFVFVIVFCGLRERDKRKNECRKDTNCVRFFRLCRGKSGRCRDDGPMKTRRTNENFRWCQRTEHQKASFVISTKYSYVPVLVRHIAIRTSNCRILFFSQREFFRRYVCLMWRMYLRIFIREKFLKNKILAVVPSSLNDDWSKFVWRRARGPWTIFASTQSNRPEHMA